MKPASTPALPPDDFPVAEADLHCHLLPAWDDGPATFEDSLALARRAYESGVRTIVVTPHVGRVLGTRQEKPSAQIPDAVAELQARLHAEGVAMTLVSGAELTLEGDMPARLRDETHLTFGGQGGYALLESTFGRWPLFAEQMLYQIALVGVTPIIAHPERLPDVQRNIELLAPVVQAGALLQVTARALKEESKGRSQCARDLLAAGMVRLIASDSHGAQSVWPQDVAHEVRRIVGDDAARQILVDNPLAIVRGLPLPQPVPVAPRPQKRGLLSLFKRRD